MAALGTWPDGAGHLGAREARELSSLRRTIGTGDRDGALRILAHIHAVADAHVVHGLAVDGSYVTSPPVAELVRRLVDELPRPGADLRRGLVTSAARHIRERDGEDGFGDDDAVDAAVRAATYALPTSILLASGGKDGQAVDWAEGSNRYGVAPFPLPGVVALSSCTASSPSVSAYDAAQRVRIGLLARALDDGLDDALEGWWNHVRDRLAAAAGLLDLACHVAVVPTPSGTDAELVATTLSRGAGRPLTIVVPGPLEVGRGTIQALLGRAFSTVAPSGRPTEPGEPVAGMPADIGVVAVEIRDEGGRPRDPADVEAEINDHLDRIAGRGHQALLHVLDGSKTGLRVPREPALRRWEARHGGRLDVVVDAAQLRVDDQAIPRHIVAGRMVIVTGSKFFAGPPFSGAVVVPDGFRSRLGTSAVPEGLVDYLDRRAVPPELGRLRAAAAGTPNVGLLLRWVAAIHEMRSYLGIPAELRNAVVNDLSVRVAAAIRSTPHVELVPVTTDPAQSDDPPPTIFTLRPRRDGRYLDEADLRLLQHAMRRDLTSAASALDPASKAWLRRRVDIGQAVSLGPDGAAGAAIRFAYSAPALTRVIGEARRVEEVRNRLAREVGDTRAALRKLTFILERWDDVVPAGPGAVAVQ